MLDGAQELYAIAEFAIPELVEWQSGLGIVLLAVVTTFSIPWYVFFRSRMRVRQGATSVVNLRGA